MPSTRIACAECALHEYDGELSAVKVMVASAKAVAYYAGAEGQPSEDAILDEKAALCAKKIVADECPIWLKASDAAGFALRAHKLPEKKKKSRKN